MLPGASVELSLYYRNEASNTVVVAATNVINSPENFSNTTHLVDFQTIVPVVQTTDAWAGQNIGIRLLSMVTTNLEGGYWDFDNVRLAVRNPVLLNPAWTNGQFQFTLRSEPGMQFDILASNDPLLTRSNWAKVGTVTNTTGTVFFSDPSPASAQRFYQAQEIP